MSGESLLSARGLEVGIEGRTLIGDLTLNVNAGECWGILGLNGAGKTTLLHTLAGLCAPLRGSVMLQERPIATLKRREIACALGLLPQDSVDPFPGRVWETVLMGRYPHLGPWRREGARDRQLAEEALMVVGLKGMEQRLLATLSGGERRRVALATLLTQDPAVYLLDEPVTHLDPRSQMALLKILSHLTSRGGKAAVMSLHDPTLAARYCQRVALLLPSGEALVGPANELLTAANLERLYGHPMLEVETPVGRAFLPA